jgi:3-oxoacyl-[acyl-carrier protein] reductase
MMKNVLISGSSKGLGQMLTSILRHEGYKVFTMGRTPSADIDLVVDLTDKEATNVLLGTFLSENIIDILICNAGTGKMPFGITSKQDLLDYFYDKNFLTARNLVNACMPFLKPKSLVIAISSIVALKDIEGAPKEYAFAKRELNKMILNLAAEQASKEIRFNIISPGNIYFSGSRWEEISNEKPEFVQRMLRDDVPLHNFITPYEIAAAIIYLSSENSRNITGLNLVIDGGQSL